VELAFGNNLSRAEPFLTISTAYIGFQGNDASSSAQLCLNGLAVVWVCRRVSVSV